MTLESNEYPLTHKTKFQGHRFMGSGEENVLNDFIIYDMEAILLMRSGPEVIKLFSCSTQLSMKC